MRSCRRSSFCCSCMVGGSCRVYRSHWCHCATDTIIVSGVSVGDRCYMTTDLRETFTSARCVFGSYFTMRRSRLALGASLNSQKVFPARSFPVNCQKSSLYPNKTVTKIRPWMETSNINDGVVSLNLPARKVLRQGSFRLFHLNQRLFIGLIFMVRAKHTYSSPRALL